MKELKNTMFIFETQNSAPEDYKGVVPCVVCLDGKYNAELTDKVTAKAFSLKLQSGAYFKTLEKEEEKEECVKNYEKRALDILGSVSKSFETSDVLPVVVMSYKDGYNLDGEEINIPDEVFGDFKSKEVKFSYLKYESREVAVKEKVEALKEVLGYIPDDLFILYL